MDAMWEIARLDEVRAWETTRERVVRARVRGASERA
jgi:hypothetical protein